MRPPRIPHPRLRRAPSLVACVIVAVATVAAGSAGGASSSVTVTFSVSSSTSISPSCATASAATSFGPVIAGTPAVTGADCSIQFGSTNDTAALRMYQQDRAGDAMFSQPFGTLDGDFGTAGISSWDAPGGGNLDELDEVRAVPDGSGRFYVFGSHSTTEAFLARFLPNGALDPTFSGGDGSDGYLLFSDSTGPNNWGRLEVQPDGRIVVATWWIGPESGSLVRRYLPSGQVDTGFGSGGTVTYDLCDPNASNNPEWIHAMRVDAQGRLVLIGSCEHVATVDASWFVVRLTANGSLDGSFATGGRWQWNHDVNYWDRVSAMVIDPAGRIVVGGETYPGGLATMTFVRLLDDGTLDAGFDGGPGNLHAGNGTVGYRLTGHARTLPHQAVIDPQGRIITAGESSNWSDATTSSSIARLTDDGTLDTTFAGTGFRIHDFAPGARDIVDDLDRWADGAMLLTGSVGNGGARDAYVARVDSAGNLDTRFGTNGRRTIDVAGGDNLGVGLETMVDGHLLMWGTSAISGSDYTTTYALLDATPVSDYDDAGGQDWSGSPATSGMFGFCVRQLGGGATAGTVAVDGGNDCGASDTDTWAGVADAGAATATIATSASGVTTGTAALRFGVRPRADQRPGTYYAPLVFEVVAPAA